MKRAWLSLALMLMFLMIGPAPVFAEEGAIAHDASVELVGSDVEILGGTFESELSMTTFVVVDPSGEVVLYCPTESTDIGGLSGEVVLLSGGSLAILTSPCVTRTTWRTQHRISS